LSGLLLTVDLTRPLRFWHMLIERNTFAPMFKSWSPMSFGSWALLVFGIFSFIAFLGALAEEDDFRWNAFRRFRWPALIGVRPPSILGSVIAIIGGLAGLFIAGYTGVLLAVTNRPIWSDTPLLGMLFIISAASTSAALMLLLAHRSRWRWTSALFSLQRMDGIVLVLELIVLVVLMFTLGPAIRGWMNLWGLLLVVGVIIAGMIVPLVMSWRQRPAGGAHASVATIAILVLIGGFLLRLVVIFSSEMIERTI
jgi:formate-dependent nitrite reductase membrane component NrfD